MNYTLELDLATDEPVRNASGRMCLQGTARTQVLSSQCRSTVHAVREGLAQVALKGTRAALTRYLSRHYARDAADLEFHMSRATPV